MLSRWWTSRRRSIRNLGFLFGSAASIITLFVSVLPDPTTYPWWGVALLAIGAILIVLLAGFEFFDRPQSHVFQRGDNKGILKYMHDWIEHGGRIAIWTRDMSWADNEKTKQLLNIKAERRELIIFLPSEIPLSQNLSEAGAEVFYYGTHRLDPPGSRFTIAQFGRDGSSVAVGRLRGDTHVIEEFRSGDHPAYYIASDLVELARSISGPENE